MGTRRVSFETWGRRDYLMDAAKYAVAQEDESDLGAVLRSLARTSGLELCGGPRSDGTALSGGRAVARHYQTTWGTPCADGGWTPEAEVWISIQVRGEEC